MKPAPFAYARPESLDEALEILGEYGDEAKVLGGGQSLMPLLNMRLARPAVLVDLDGIRELSGISAGSTVTIKAMTRQIDVEESRPVGAALPLLPAALRHVGHTAIRSRGTVGGSIAHADPAAEMPTAFVALEGQAVVAGRDGTRTVPADRFFGTYFTTDVAEDEILTEVRFPALTPTDRWAFLEVARRHGDFALVGVAVVLSMDGTEPEAACLRARVALAGVAETPVRLPEAEAALVGAGTSSAEAIAAAAAAAAAAVDPPADVHASSRYRIDVTETLVRRAVSTALAS